MKRHPSLQGLLREHHLILSHASELRWAAEGHGNLTKACREFLDYWRKRGMPHLQQEEERLFPYCEKCPCWERTEGVDLVFKQHEEIRSLITQLEACLKTGSDPVPVASVVSKLLDQHVRHEERVLFEFIQDTLTESELDHLGEYLK